MSKWNRRDPLKRNLTDGYASALYRAKGLGSSKSGSGQWWVQRVTAVALIPLTVWLIASLIAFASDASYQKVLAWLQHPVVMVLMLLLIVAMFWHMKLGLRMMVEDYIHTDRIKFAALAAVEISCYTLMAIGIFSICYLGFR